MALMPRKATIRCAGIAVLVAIALSATAEEEAELMWTLDLPYSEHHTDRRVMDVVMPRERGNGRCIFFVHGGGWRAGDKESWHSVMTYFAERGYVCTSAEYRLLPDAHLPEMLEDVRLAMSFVREHAERWGFTPDQIAAYGSSAGGHLVGMLATIAPDDDLGMTDEITIRDTRPKAAVCMCPVLSIPRYRESLVPELLGPEWDLAPELGSPEYRVTGHEPPFLIVVGDADESTPIADQEAICHVLRDHGVRCELVVVPGAGHGAFYGVRTEQQHAALAAVEPFLESVFATGTTPASQ